MKNNEQRESVILEYLKSIINWQINKKQEKDNKKSEKLDAIDEKQNYQKNDENNIPTFLKNLKNQYMNLRVEKNSLLQKYLRGENPSHVNKPLNPIFPFGFNLSQKDAIKNALNSEISIIQGPPGTGKTQTILNIIAQAIMLNKVVAVVSNNNAAIENVHEKLNQNGLGFITAPLGKKDNLDQFLKTDNQTKKIEEYKRNTINFSEKNVNFKALKEKAQNLYKYLENVLENQNNLAKLKSEIEKLKTEFQHFQKSININGGIAKKYYKKNDASIFLKLWLEIEKCARKNKKKIGFFKKIKFRCRYGINDKNFFKLKFNEMILSVQFSFYSSRINELDLKKNSLLKNLEQSKLKENMKEYTETCMQIFKSFLATRLKKPPAIYEKSNFNYKKNKVKPKNFYTFTKDYPVILSTTHSIKNVFKYKIYDLVIVDESSQVDLLTGIPTLSCARQLVVVGDKMQLSHIVEEKQLFETIENNYKSKDWFQYYCYTEQNLLTSIDSIFPTIPRILLKEHYRCHPKIIEFCNQKFYNDELIILTNETKTDQKPIWVYKTVSGKSEYNTNWNQIKCIRQEIIPQHKLSDSDLGIITPYRDQVDELLKTFETYKKVKIGTVNSFQGRENDVIIFSTVKKRLTNEKIAKFLDDPKRLNVAISRAKHQLFLVIDTNLMNELENDNHNRNFLDLIRYIRYNRFSIIESKVHSIFEYLYSAYNNERKKILKNWKRISKYESENITYALICETLQDKKKDNLKVAVHVPLTNLGKDFSLLTEEERKYALNPWTHVDFLIYNKFNKMPVCGIETDGVSFHKKGTKQEKRDKNKDMIFQKWKLQLLRLSTRGHDEKEQLSKLLENF